MKCVHLLPTQGILMQNLAEKLQFHWSHSSLFAFEKQSKNLILRVFLTLKYPLVATFKEKCTRSSRKYVSESGKSIPDLAEEL